MEVTGFDEESATAKFEMIELAGLANALNEVLHGPGAIAEWDFQTRMAVTPEEARLTLKQIGHLLRQMRGSDEGEPDTRSAYFNNMQ